LLFDPHQADKVSSYTATSKYQTETCQMTVKYKIHTIKNGKLTCPLPALHARNGKVRTMSTAMASCLSGGGYLARAIHVKTTQALMKIHRQLYIVNIARSNKILKHKHRLIINRSVSSQSQIGFDIVILIVQLVLPSIIATSCCGNTFKMLYNCIKVQIMTTY
jgi:hypothetical protein